MHRINLLLFIKLSKECSNVISCMVCHLYFHETKHIISIHHVILSFCLSLTWLPLHQALIICPTLTYQTLDHVCIRNAEAIKLRNFWHENLANFIPWKPCIISDVRNQVVSMKVLRCLSQTNQWKFWVFI